MTVQRQSSRAPPVHCTPGGSGGEGRQPILYFSSAVLGCVLFRLVRPSRHVVAR